MDASRPGYNEMHYMIRKSDQMQKHNFGVMFPSALFMETALDPPEYEK
jgi:hypothetical protein